MELGLNTMIHSIDAERSDAAKKSIVQSHPPEPSQAHPQATPSV